MRCFTRSKVLAHTAYSKCILCMQYSTTQRLELIFTATSHSHSICTVTLTDQLPFNYNCYYNYNCNCMHTYYRGEKMRPVRCPDHVVPGMQDVIRGKCEAVGCAKKPTHCIPTSPGCKPRFCASHRVSKLLFLSNCCF
jgi:hypothetical protein